MKMLRILACGLLCALPGYSAVTISSSAVFNASGGDYTYTYSILNTGDTEDLALISIRVMPGLMPGPITAPAGFLGQYDAFGGWLNFLEDTDQLTPQTFAPQMLVGDFTFRFQQAPNPSSYLAFDALGAEFSGAVDVAPVPEPSVGAILAAGLATLIRRRRRSA